MIEYWSDGVDVMQLRGSPESHASHRIGQRFLGRDAYQAIDVVSAGRKRTLGGECFIPCAAGQCGSIP